MSNILQKDAPKSFFFTAGLSCTSRVTGVLCLYAFFPSINIVISKAFSCYTWPKMLFFWPYPMRKEVARNTHKSFFDTSVEKKSLKKVCIFRRIKWRKKVFSRGNTIFHRWKCVKRSPFFWPWKLD